ncbi:MAG: YraN family protein [Bacteroidales bacterium]
MNNWEKGQRAEGLAARYLRTRGYRILKTNWRWGHRELDLVARYGEVLVVVEVKAMFGNRVNVPSETVDPKKQRHIVLATDAFIRLHRHAGPTRFDVISVHYAGDGVHIEHLPGAFFPDAE